MGHNYSKMTEKKSHSIKIYTQQQLKELEKLAGENLDKIVKAFNWELKEYADKYVGVCPIHGGDNRKAFNLYISGHSQAGNWKCWTRGCQDVFLPTIIGLVRAQLSKEKHGFDIDRRMGDNKMCSVTETVEVIQKILNCDIGSIVTDEVYTDKNTFCKQMRVLNKPEEKEKEKENLLNVSVESLKSYIKVPSKYYLDRGVQEDTLVRYYVGDCDSKGKEMYKRAVVPILNDSGTHMIGCSGRSIYEKCQDCECYHDPDNQCPSDDYRWMYSKWRHNKGFRAERHLYNHWSAQKYIRESGLMILTESPGNVWKLEEIGIHNSVGTFGAHLTDEQKQIIDTSGAMYLLLINDGDNAGRTANNQIIHKCGKSYVIRIIDMPDGKDVASSESEFLVEIINKQIQNMGIV